MSGEYYGPISIFLHILSSLCCHLVSFNRHLISWMRLVAKKKITVPKKKNLMNNFLFGVSSVSYLCLYVHFSHCHKLKGAFILLSFLQSSLCVRVNDPAVKASFILYFSPVFHLVSAGFSETFKAVKKMRIYLRAQLHHCRYHIN